jgi:hypothetical protein
LIVEALCWVGGILFKGNGCHVRLICGANWHSDGCKFGAKMIEPTIAPFLLAGDKRMIVESFSVSVASSWNENPTIAM